VLVVLCFDNCPPKPPSKSAELRMSHLAEINDPSAVRVPFLRELRDDVVSVAHLARKKGFLTLVTGFSIAEAIINSFSSKMNVILAYRNVPRLSVRWVGSGFILACLVGSGFIGSALDRTKNYKGALVLTLCMAVGALSCSPLLQLRL